MTFNIKSDMTRSETSLLGTSLLDTSLDTLAINAAPSHFLRMFLGLNVSTVDLAKGYIWLKQSSNQRETDV